MANLSVRRGGEPRGETAAWDPLRMMERAFDPVRMMREMMGADPFGGLVAPMSGMFAPDVEIKETKDAYVFRADLPGVRPEDVEVSVVGNRLTVSGKREEEKRQEDDRYFAYERSYGSFSRSFVLPEHGDLDKLRASMESGVLEIVVPKRAEMQPRRIEIGKGGKETKAEPAGKGEKKAA